MIAYAGFMHKELRFVHGTHSFIFFFTKTVGAMHRPVLSVHEYQNIPMQPIFRSA